ncbi:MAG: sodium:solute symporter [Bacteroidota bacterium]
MEGITTLDLSIIGIYFVTVLGIGLYIARSTKTGEDLFLGGRTFGWGLIGLSLFASNISSSTIIGLSGAAYSTGIVQSVFEWMSGIPLIIAALVFVPLYLKSRITTIPEFLERRFDKRSQQFFSAITIFISIVVDTAGGLYAGALVLQTFFPNLILWQTCFVLALIAGLYTAFGGLKAVVYTDAIQAIILILGCSILTYMLFEQLDFSWDAVVAAAPEGHFSIVRPLSDESLPWPGLFLGVPILGFWYWSTNQYIVQRILGGRNIQHARWGVILAGFLKIIPLFIMVIPGAMAISLFPDLGNQDAVFPTIVVEVLPAGLVGLVLAGLISAIMSSVDSTLNSASTLIVVDFIKPAKEKSSGGMSPEETAKYGRISTIILMVVAALWAPMIENFEGLWAYLQQMFAIVVPPIAAIFLLGVFYKRGNAAGAFWTLLIGTVLGTVVFLLCQFDMWPIHFTINVGIMLAVSCLIFIGVSNQTAEPPLEKIENYTFKKSMIAEGMEDVPLYQDYRLHMAILLGLIAYIFIVFF